MGFQETNIAPEQSSVDFAYQSKAAQGKMVEQTEDFSIPQTGPLAGLSKRAIYALHGRALEPSSTDAGTSQSPSAEPEQAYIPVEMLTIGEANTVTPRDIGLKATEAEVNVIHIGKNIEWKERREVLPERDMNVERVKRDYDLAKAVAACEGGEQLKESDERKLMAALQNRGWYKLLDGKSVKPGNILVSFLVPSGEVFGIKHLNDELFGSQRTDEMLAKRRALFSREMHGTLAEQVATSIKEEAYSIETPTTGVDDYERHVQETLSEKADRMREEMTVLLAEMALEERSSAVSAKREALEIFLQTMLGKETATSLQEKGELFVSFQHVLHQVEEQLSAADARFLQKTISASDRDHAASLVQAARVNIERMRSELREIIRPALQADPALGYRITFGMSRVKEKTSDTDFTHIEQAVAEATEKAFGSRSAPEYGGMYSQEDAEAMLKESSRLRKEIGEQFLTDGEGRLQRILEWKTDGLAVMNANLIRDMRKGVFLPVKGEEALFETAKAYLAGLNFFDITKPYTHEELAGGALYGSDGTVADQVASIQRMIGAIESRSLDADTRKGIGSELRKEGKDRTCTSAIEFNSRALEIPNCTYVSLDVLDVGPELLREYERLIQLVEHGRMTFDEARLTAGDATTKKLRAFRSKVSDIYREKVTNDSPLMFVGGDEVVMALPTATATDNFLMALRKIRLNESEKASIRVIRCAIGTGERSSDLHDTNATIRQHLAARKIAEDGSTLAKTIERDSGTIERLIYDLPRDEREAHLSALNRLNIRDFAVRQVAGGERSFDLILENPDQPDQTIRETSAKVLQGMADLRNRLNEEVQTRREELFVSLSSAYPRLRQTDMPAVLRRYHRADANAADGDFKTFMKQYV